MKSTFRTLAIAAAICGAASAASIGVNFTESGGHANQQLAAGTAAGINAAVNWNNVAGNEDLVGVAILADDGITAGGTVTWSSGGVWGDGTANADAGLGIGNAQLKRGYLDDQIATTFDVTGVPYAKYILVVYYSTDDNGSLQAQGLTANGIYTLPTAAAGTNRWLQNTNLDATNTATVNGLTGDLSVTMDNRNTTATGRATIAGFQIFLDTDGDTIPDVFETNTGTYNSPTDTGSDPNNVDTDGDSVGDEVEVALGSDPNINDDTDGDGIDNLEESTGSLNTGYGSLPTDAIVADSDGDNLSDGFEILTSLTDPNNIDTDADTIQDDIDTDPLDPNNDQDGDGIGNQDEVNGTSNPWDTGAPTGPPGDSTDILLIDTDADGVNDGDEMFTTGTDPNNPDTDGDSFTDGTEILAGTDPLDALSFPLVTVANQVGLNFTGGRSPVNVGIIDAAFTGDGSDIAGAPGAAQAGWNNLGGANGLNVPLLDEAGAGTSMSVNFSAPNTWSVDGTIDNNGIGVGFPGDADAALMQGYLDSNPGNEPTVTVNGIPYPNYDVIVYFEGGAALDRAATYTAGGETKNAVVNDATIWPILAGGASYTRAYAVGEAGHYVVFHGLSGSSVTVTGVVIDFRTSINAIQVINATEDNDGGGIPDSTELLMGLNPADGGVDDGVDEEPDVLTNFDEVTNETNHLSADTDGDGVEDGIEVLVGGTDPLNPDTDGDGIPDGTEDANGNGVLDPGETDPALADTDGDGLSDSDEITTLTDPRNPDSDGDTISDGDEVNIHGTDPNSDDTDGDNLLDQDEIAGNGITVFTDPLLADTDDDGLNDDVEIAGPTDALDPDTDLDSLEDGYEVNVSLTDPLLDTDPGVVAKAIGFNYVSDRNGLAGLAGVDIGGHPDYLQANWNSTFPTVTGPGGGTEFDIELPDIGVLTQSDGVILTNDGLNTGTPTTTVVWASEENWNTNNGTANANSKLMNGFADDNGGAANLEFTFSGVPYAFCDVIVYVGSDGNGRNGTVALLDGTFTQVAQAGYNTFAQHGGFQAADYLVSTDTTGTAFPAANVVIFPSAVGGDLTVQLQRQGANTGIFAIQLVESGPPPANLANLDISRTGPALFELTWTGGDGTNTVQSATAAGLATDTWTDVVTGVASPAGIVVDPNVTTELFFRVIEP